MTRRAEAPSVPKTVRLSPAEVEIAARAAALNGQNISDFIRDATLTAASECLEEVAAPTPRRRVIVVNAPVKVRP